MDLLADIVVQNRVKRHWQMFETGMDPQRIADISGFSLDIVKEDVLRGKRHGSAEERGRAILVQSKQGVFVEVWSVLDSVRREGFGAWYRSQLPQRMVRVKESRDSDGRESWEQVTEERTTPGDPRFLSQVSDAVWRQAQLAGFVADGGAGRGPVGAEHGDTVDESDTVAIVEVSSRAEAAAVAGKRYCRISGPSEGAVVDAVSVSAAAEVVEGAGSGPSAGAVDLGGADGAEAAVGG